MGEYIDLDVEEEVTAKGIEPPAHWPSREGKIEVEGLVARYAPEVSSRSTVLNQASPVDSLAVPLL